MKRFAEVKSKISLNRNNIFLTGSRSRDANTSLQEMTAAAGSLDNSVSPNNEQIVTDQAKSAQ